MSRTIALFGAFALLLIVQPASAAEDLDLPEGEAWTHPHSRIVVPAELGGYARSHASAYADDYLDVGLAFEEQGSGEAITISIYRITNGAVPVWFAQSQAAIEGRDIYQGWNWRTARSHSLLPDLRSVPG